MPGCQAACSPLHQTLSPLLPHPAHPPAPRTHLLYHHRFIPHGRQDALVQAAQPTQRSQVGRSSLRLCRGLCRAGSACATAGAAARCCRCLVLLLVRGHKLQLPQVCEHGAGGDVALHQDGLSSAAGQAAGKGDG